MRLILETKNKRNISNLIDAIYLVLYLIFFFSIFISGIIAILYLFNKKSIECDGYTLKHSIRPILVFDGKIPTVVVNDWYVKRKGISNLCLPSYMQRELIKHYADM